MRPPPSIPEGDRLLWQAIPHWRHFAMSAVPVGWVALYLVALVLFCMVDGIWNVAAAYAMLSGVAVACLLLLGYAMARSSTYSITDRNVVIEYGFALPKTVTIPLTRVASAALRTNRDGTGDITLRLATNRGLAPVLLWPHIRVVRFRAEPVLRAVPAAATSAGILARVLAATDRPAPEPVAVHPPMMLAEAAD